VRCRTDERSQTNDLVSVHCFVSLRWEHIPVTLAKPSRQLTRGCLLEYTVQGQDTDWVRRRILFCLLYVNL
jgi:hypothetical protein